jgi:hypothetical protein
VNDGDLDIGGAVREPPNPDLVVLKIPQTIHSDFSPSGVVALLAAAGINIKYAAILDYHGFSDVSSVNDSEVLDEN